MCLHLLHLQNITTTDLHFCNSKFITRLRKEIFFKKKNEFKKHKKGASWLSEESKQGRLLRRKASTILTAPFLNRITKSKGFKPFLYSYNCALKDTTNPAVRQLRSKTRSLFPQPL
jgi:hypothetical protein